MSDSPQTPTPTEPQSPTPEQTPTPTPTPSPTPDAPPADEPKSLLSDDKKPEASPPFDAEAITVPDGFDKSEKNTAWAGFTALAAETGLSQTQAQKLVDFHVAETQKAVEAQTASWTATQDAWIAEVKADKEIGNLDVLRQTIAKVAGNREFTDPKFEEAMALTGAGNHPAVLRTLFRWAKALGEGGPVQGTPPARTGAGALDPRNISPGTAIYGPDGPKSGIARH
jgi:hypothetical protein